MYTWNWIFLKSGNKQKKATVKKLEYLQCKYDYGNQTSPSSVHICKDKAEMKKLSMIYTSTEDHVTLCNQLKEDSYENTVCGLCQS